MGSSQHGQLCTERCLLANGLLHCHALALQAESAPAPHECGTASSSGVMQGARHASCSRQIPACTRLSALSQAKQKRHL